MDTNLVVLQGTLAAVPEIRQFESGSRLMRLLISIHQRSPRRVDVIPVILWEPSDDLVDADLQPGQRVWAAGQVQRRFWAGHAEGERSRLEVVADQVTIRVDEEEAAWIVVGRVPQEDEVPA